MKLGARQSARCVLAPAILDRDIAALRSSPAHAIAGQRRRSIGSVPPPYPSQQPDGHHFPPCSARAASGHAAAAPASSVMNSRLSIDRIAFDPRRAGLQNIELARISQDVRERFYNLLAIGETGHCPATGRLKRESPDGFGSGLPRGHSPAPHAGQRHLPRKLDYRLTAPGLHHEREAALLQLLVSLEP